MECNKDEALRAKTIAENKLEKKDFFGAKKIALKAQALYPMLDGLSQMLTMLEVYVSAENKISGEVDWYGVLGVNPSADDDVIRKHYKKLALVLHPDKNKSIGADGAFKLISEAWSLLSDKGKRSAYNQRRGFRGFQQKVPLDAAAGQTTQSRSNGMHNFGNRTTSAPNAQTAQTTQSGSNETYNFGNTSTQVPKAQTAAQKAQSQTNGTHSSGSKTTSVLKTKSNGTKASKKPKPTPPPQKPDTFWTICDGCKFHYEFVRMYLNGTLLCPTCKKVFIAKETVPPFNTGNSAVKVPSQQKQVSGDNLLNQNGNDSGKNVQAAKNLGLEPIQNAPAAKKSRSGPNGNAPAAKKSRAGPNVHANDPGKHVPAANKSGPVPNQNAHDPGMNVPAAMSGPGQVGSNSVRHVNYQKLPVSGTASVSSKGHSTAAKAATIQQAQNKLKRPYAEANAFAGLQESRKKKRPDDDSSQNMIDCNMVHANGGFGIWSASRINDFSGTCRQPNSAREFTPLEYRNVMMERAQKDIQSKLKTWNLENSAEAAGKEKDDTNESKKEGLNSTISTKRHRENWKSGLFTNGSSDKTSKGDAAAATMTVPDPDFHDFDNDRTESSFGDNEVWAAYDNNDGMPRLYALIHKVISRKPFKLRISWLNSKTNCEFSAMDWIGSGFYKTCGEFRVGKYETFTSINAFSHKVNWSKNPRGSVLTFPREDDVWALYKNWSSEWDEHTPDDVVHKYDMVIVLDNYNEEHGVSVAPLVKVVGFKTVFRPDLDPQVVKRVPKEEMFRFSHRVPHHVLTGQEAQIAPVGCLELDPAAMPLELIQVVAEPNEYPVAPSKASVD